jgi:hypothetical protein
MSLILTRMFRGHNENSKALIVVYITNDRSPEAFKIISIKNFYTLSSSLYEFVCIISEQNFKEPHKHGTYMHARLIHVQG